MTVAQNGASHHPQITYERDDNGVGSILKSAVADVKTLPKKGKSGFEKSL